MQNVFLFYSLSDSAEKEGPKMRFPHLEKTFLTWKYTSSSFVSPCLAKSTSQQQDEITFPRAARRKVLVGENSIEASRPLARLDARSVGNWGIGRGKCSAPLKGGPWVAWLGDCGKSSMSVHATSRNIHNGESAKFTWSEKTEGLSISASRSIGPSRRKH